MIDKELLRNLKLIVFDVDGTLVNSNDEIGEYTIKLVEELKNHDVKFSFASGRQHSSLQKHAETLKLKNYIISLDGTLIKSHPENSKLFESVIPRKYVRKAISLADKYLVKVALCHDEAIYYDENNLGVHELLEKYGAEYQEVRDYNNYIQNTLELVLAGDYKESVKFIKRKMDFPYSFGLKTSFYRSHSHEGIYYLELRKKGCSKGTGLKKLAKHLKIKMKETAVMGDWYNDISLFKTDAIKVAVGNAVPELKRNADFITHRSNDEDATAEFLAMVLKAKKNS